MEGVAYVMVPAALLVLTLLLVNAVLYGLTVGVEMVWSAVKGMRF